MELGLFRSTILDSMDAAAPFNFSENAENGYIQIAPYTFLVLIKTACALRQL